MLLYRSIYRYHGSSGNRDNMTLVVAHQPTTEHVYYHQQG